MLAALVLLGPGVVLACSRAVPNPWTLRTPDERFELSMKPQGDSPRASLTLFDHRAGKVVWQRELEYGLSRGEALVSADGRYVVLIRSFSETVVAYGPEGKESGQWSLGSPLLPSERRRLVETPCGVSWVESPQLDGDVLTLRVPRIVSMPQRPPPADSLFQGTPFRIELSTNRITRGALPPPPSTASLIQAFRRETRTSVRFGIARELLIRAHEADRRGGAPELSRFWLEVLRDPSEAKDLYHLATEALDFIGTDEDIRRLAEASLPADVEDSSAALLSLFERRLPEDAVRFSLYVIQERRPPEHLRERALAHLGGRAGEDFSKVLMFALRDPSSRVRKAALHQMEKRGASRHDFELAIPSLNDPDASVRRAAEASLCRVLWTLSGDEFQTAFAQARRARADVKLAECPR
ncbi:HEAT repeat domain-containing protein [Archangium lipolyticum]|uniref:HEAT repeat domain-containing protein n=1 Tax=Archangium lipolyticum TaxID=2970465 RepID=UPI00214A66E1|nr:HEAT repeat domain-containing protein [Archangium lipolyticum]